MARNTNSKCALLCASYYTESQHQTVAALLSSESK